MKAVKMVFFVAVLFLVRFDVCHGDDKPGVEWLTYQGAWFNIQYPADFSVTPSLIDRNNPEAYSSVFFKSPDGKFEFYVLAPRYNMEPADLALNEDEEILLESKEKKVPGLIFSETTIGAKDVAYVRVIEDLYDTSGPNTFVRQVFSMKYQNPRELKQIKELYKRFKESLVTKNGNRSFKVD